MLYPKLIIENKSYTNLLNQLGKVSNICAVLNQAVIRCNSNTYIFTTSNKDISEIAKNLDISQFTTRKCIRELVSLEILIKRAKGSYSINRDLITLDYKKGKWM